MMTCFCDGEIKRYDLQYNGETGESHNVILQDYPQFSGGTKQYTVTAVAGMRGELVSDDEGQENLSIDCVFSVISDKFALKLDDLRRWLSGTGTLQFTDGDDGFYRVWKIDYGDIERELRHYGTFSVTFVCEPFKFVVNGQDEKTIDEVAWNAYSESRPIYQIAGEGVCTLTVNGNEMIANVGQNLTIDTERMLAYRTDGTPQNTEVTGDYEGLYLIPGENSVSITSGFALSIIPNWGYKV